MTEIVRGKDCDGIKTWGKRVSRKERQRKRKRSRKKKRKGREETRSNRNLEKKTMKIY